MRTCIEAIGGGFEFGQCDLEECSLGKLVSPARRREAVANTTDCYRVSERRACRVLGQCRATQRYKVRQIDDEERLRTNVISLSKKYGRYGDRRIMALLQREGWEVNHKRVERLWRREGLKVPQNSLRGNDYG